MRAHVRASLLAIRSEAPKELRWETDSPRVLALYVLATLYGAPRFMGPAYWIPAFWVPALLVTHYITFIVLLRDREPS